MAAPMSVFWTLWSPPVAQSCLLCPQGAAILNIGSVGRAGISIGSPFETRVWLLLPKFFEANGTRVT